MTFLAWYWQIGHLGPLLLQSCTVLTCRLRTAGSMVMKPHMLHLILSASGWASAKCRLSR